MKLSKLWKALTRDQKRSWMQWARSNRVLLPDGNVRRVSGHKAFTVILNNRAIAGEASNPTVVPAAVAWLEGVLSLNDAGPFTENAGFIGFRNEDPIAAGTKWFVWATPPVGAEVVNPRPLLRFVTCLVPGEVPADEVIAINTPYLAVNGSWDGPLTEGEWPSPTFVWFRVHHYGNGQLSPGVMMKGQIQIEL